MSRVWMQSFDRDGLNEILARPAAKQAKRLAERLRRKEAPHCTAASSLPREEPELTRYVEILLAADDWYAGKSLAGARAVDGFVYDIFDDKTLAQTLQLEPLGDGILSEILEIAKGNLAVDESRNTPRARHFAITKAEGPLVTDLHELLEFGSRPFRHPAWNRQAAEELLARNNPFIQGAETVYFPEYSIHSPAQVDQLVQDLERVADRMQHALGGIKSKTIRAEIVEDFECFVASIEQAAGAGQAVCAWHDY